MNADRTVLALKTHHAGERLHPSDSVYKQWIFRYTFLELEKDIGPHGDITTSALFSDPTEIEAVLISNSEGVLAGMQEAKYFLVGSDPAFKPRLGHIQSEFLKKDGDILAAGDQILRLHGSVHDILKIERILLNLLQRMSGIATLTRSYVDRLGKYGSTVLLTPTRKTIWGLLDKRAVVVGGGGTHRLDLSDAVLVKDTHMKILAHNIPLILKLCSNNPGRFLEIEVESREDALEAMRVFHKLHIPGGLSVPGVIMFDNMKPSVIKETISELKESVTFDQLVLFEASGGIRYENLESYARTGVDIISVGALTHSAPSLDFSLELI